MSKPRLFQRCLIRLSPQDEEENVTAFLQGLVTNDIATAPGMAGMLPVWTALLSAQGKTMFDFLVWPGERGALLLDCEADTADALVKRLSLYRLRRKITIARDETLGVYWQTTASDRASADPRLAVLGYRWIRQVSDSDVAADEDWLAHRLKLGVAEGNAELSDILWLETNAADLNGVSFEKGCYIGQENTARMNWRQKINRRLVVVPINQSDEKRQKAAYHHLGFAVDHLRVTDIDPAIVPGWMRIRPEN